MGVGENSVRVLVVTEVQDYNWTRRSNQNVVETGA